MLSSDFRRIKAAFADWIHIGKWRYPLAVTLTCKKALNDEEGYQRPITEGDCHKNLAQVMRVMNRRFLGSARSKKQQIPLFPVLEKNADNRFHYHAIIDVPEAVDARFVQSLEYLWRYSRVGHWETDIQVASDQGWVRYLLKSRSKSHYLDAIDVRNLVLPTDPPLVAKAGMCRQCPTWYTPDPIRQWIAILHALKSAQLDLKDRRPF